ncbi:MAG: redox-sensing transcriptional repressor Rex [Acidimicrobiales bacterium]|nr:redox-sensing transcriptional repressor Rex [Acidimicrobiales bacterium]
MTTAPRPIPEATVTRLPGYRAVLVELDADGQQTVSSEQLAEQAGVNAAKVRKDLSYLGSYGTRGVGYDVRFLLFQVSRVLGLTTDWPVVIVGMGNLGRALANYRGFAERGFPVAALVDIDPEKVGGSVAGIPITPLAQLDSVVAAQAISIGIIATPADAAQMVADRLVAAGVSSILNFTPTMVNVPEDVPLRQVDLATELQILSFYQQQHSGPQKAVMGPPADLA